MLLVIYIVNQLLLTTLLQKANQKEFRTEKVIKRKGDKLYVKLKGSDNSFNSWINKKTLHKNEHFAKPF